jgi:hypothetical protein
MENMIDPFDRPQPGESLTSSPDVKAPYEQPPVFTDLNEAMEELYLRVTEEEILDDILDLMRVKMPVEDIAQTVLFEGFRTGNYNPDLMLLMIEPTIFMFLALAESAGISAVLYPEEDFDMDASESSSKALSSVHALLLRKGQGKPENTVEGKIEASEGGLTVGDKVIEKPEGISDSLLSKIKGSTSVEEEE